MLFTPPRASGLQLIATAAPAGVATVDFTAGLDSTFDRYIITLENLTPVATGLLGLRVSRDGGASWDEVSPSYLYGFLTPAGFLSGSAGMLMLNSGGGISATADYGGISGAVTLHDPANAGKRFRLSSDLSAMDQRWVGSGYRDLAGAVNGVRFFFGSGNIASGKVKLYGVQKA